ncbi:MAG: ATP-dependent Clp protease proteolytic subunit [Thermoplasmata archaeon]
MTVRKFDKEWVEAYFSHGVDVQNRRLFLGDIDHESIDAAIKGMYLMETNSNTEPIELFISSYGGEVYDAIALYDIIGTVKCPVHTFAYGKCMSAAPLLLACGEPGHRWVAQHTFFMHHDGSNQIEGKTTSLKVEMAHLEKLDKLWTQLLVQYSNKTFKWWDDRSKRSGDFFFSADEAIEWGIADAIWSERD